MTPVMTTPGSNHRYRVLIIDDNAAIHEDFRKILGEVSGARTALRDVQSTLFGGDSPSPAGTFFDIDCASQGEEGLGLVRKALADGRPYSVAFVDGRMPPGWDGIETISHLWRAHPELQVVLCTAYSDYSWDQIRRVLGETDSMVILKKPFDNVEVLQLTHTLTNKWELNRQVQGRLADLDRLVSERTEQSRQSLALLEASIAQSPSGILIADAPDVTIRWANAAALGIRGETGQPLTGIEVARHAAHWHTFRPDGTPYPSEELPLSRAVLKGDTTRNEEVVIRDAQGVDRWVSANAAPIRNPDGAISAGIVVFHDITERKRAEEERERLQAQLTQAQKMESVGRLAGGVAHDFNNMLGVILGHIELALEQVGPGEPLHDDLEEVQKAAKRSADLTRQLLAFARKQTIAPRVLNLNATIEGMLKMLRRLIGEDIELAWKPCVDLWPVRQDPSQMDQILANLCVNARDAIAGVGKVTIETDNTTLDEDYCARHAGFTPGDYVLLAVSDTGCGMNAETLSHLFEPFFTTKAIGRGTGLGLATVYGAVRQNYGFINVHSEPGRGTTFEIYLPRHATEAVRETAEDRPHAAAQGSGTILLVEDEPAILKLTRRVLEGLGYTVLVACTPGEAIRLAREHPGRIDLLFSDVIMPEMNGRDLARNLQSIQPNIRLLFMSGYTADVITQQGVLDPSVDFIQKPFSPRALGVKIREMLEQ